MTTPGITSSVTYDLLTDPTWNATTPVGVVPSPRIALIRLVRTVVIFCALLTIMISMGCSITVADLKKGIRQPLSALIGMLCQFVILPLTGFCMSLAFSLPTPYALSVLIVSCSPGGNISSVFTYWTNGDVCLSVCMTAVSTLAAIGMMPLNLLIYSRRWTDKKAVIPFINIIIGLVAIIIPVIIGMIIRWKKEKWTKPISLVGTIIGIILLITSVVLDYIAVPTLFDASWRLWLSAGLVPPIGFLVGYIISFISRRTPQHCRTIAFETGCQNVVLALALIKLTFRGDFQLQAEMIKFPSMYAMFMVIYAVCFITTFRLYVRRKTESDYEFTAIKMDKKVEDKEGSVEDGEEKIK
ncbi:ileal sodium/bile acid cotransporter-like [Lytechinus variegatus]|uniref:ileal sodium/bile acid cotransporter-like n=1 Tax=Lytechinus variegatus TaxID=7654 RepID=UPI001BB11281|nr:ileal sodium/bile acid cotransporter-like [Lytechinus variegatus]